MLRELLLEENREKYYEMLGINISLFRRQRIQHVIAMILLWLAGVVGLFWFKGMSAETVLLTLAAPAFGYMGWKIPYWNMMKLHNQRKDKLAFMFPEFLTTFISLLGSQSGGNVIQTLRLTSDYVKEPLKAQLVKLVDTVTVNSDPESAYMAFRGFADFIGTREASQVMMLVYEMYVHGTDEGALSELEDKIDRLNDNKLDELVLRKSTKLRGMAIPSLVLTTAFIFIWVGVVIVQVMSKAMDGLNF